MNAIIRRSPTRSVTLPRALFYPTRLIDEVDTLAKRVWDADTLAAGFEMYEQDEELVLKAELPGVKKEGFEVSLEEDYLTIKAEKNHEEVSEGATYYARERSYGKYSRSIRLPFAVEGEKVSATLENGVLEVRLPKAEEAKPKQIEVKAA
jgi:HSP20 family protein